jgi:hypothetical protein
LIVDLGIMSEGSLLQGRALEHNIEGSALK